MSTLNAFSANIKTFVLNILHKDSPMIVPEYWAEAKIRYNHNEQQITIQRFGWSDISQDDAQHQAKTRAYEALQNWINGKQIIFKELKINYNGAEGLPIREQIISRHDDIVITRNSYGALCLNTPDVAFADIDFYKHPLLSRLNFFKEHWSLILLCITLILSIAIGLTTYNFNLFWIALIITVIAFMVETNLSHEHRYYILLRKLEKFSLSNPVWGFRLYETPAGLRVLFTHKTFSPHSAEIKKFFNSFRVDPLYSLMCKNQQCFRARLTPKPWRIGLKPMNPRDQWPISPNKLAARNNWINNYQAKAEHYAACRFIKSFGNQIIDEKVIKVIELHDHFSKALSYLPIA